MCIVESSIQDTLGPERTIIIRYPHSRRAMARLKHYLVPVAYVWILGKCLKLKGLDYRGVQLYNYRQKYMYPLQPTYRSTLAMYVLHNYMHLSVLNKIDENMYICKSEEVVRHQYFRVPNALTVMSQFPNQLQ